MEMAVKYWKVEQGFDTFYDENGFCAYAHKGDEFFIAHLYAETDKGRSGKFYKRVQDFAKELGCTYITNFVELNEYNKENYTRKLLIQMRYGHKVEAVLPGRIILLKELY